MNRSTLYEYLRNDTGLEIRSTKIGKGSYPVLKVPYDWEYSFLLINNMKVIDFQSLVLFSNELVIRFWVKDDCQVNIPYKDIEYLEVRKDMDIGYIGLHNDEKMYY